MNVTTNEPGAARLDADIDLLRQQFLQALEELGASSQRVHRSLDEAGDAFVLVREQVERNANVSDFGDAIQPIPLRAALSSSLDELERNRHRVQRLLFRLLYSEGKSMSEIARMWGISRQLVSRLLNEAD